MSENIEDILKDIPIRGVSYRILVEVIRMDKQTKGGIYIPDNAAERRDNAADKGIILSIGKYVTDCEVEVGDKVLMKRYAGIVFSYKDKKYALVSDEDIGGVIEKHVDINDIII